MSADQGKSEQSILGSASFMYQLQLERRFLFFKDNTQNV